MILKTIFVMVIIWDAPAGITMNSHWGGAKDMKECLSVLYQTVAKGHPFRDRYLKDVPVKIAKCEAVKKWEGQTLRYDDTLTIGPE